MNTKQIEIFYRGCFSLAFVIEIWKVTLPILHMHKSKELVRVGKSTSYFVASGISQDLIASTRNPIVQRTKISP